jgi:tetratricopeptide (TPR) repeat protein
MRRPTKLLERLCLSTLFQVAWMNATLASPESAWSQLYKEGEHALFIGDYQTAERAYGSALELLKRSGDHSARLKFTLEKLTRSFLLDNDLKSAEVTYSQLRELIKTGDHSSKLEQVFLVDLKELANAYERKWNRYHDQKCLEHSLELLEVASGEDDAKSVEEMVTLSRAYINEGQVEKGIDLLKRATSASEKKFGKNQTGLDDNLFRLAMECQVHENYKSANQIAMYLIRMANADKGSLRVGLPVFYVFLGTNTLALGNKVQANECFAKAIEEGSKLKRGMPERDKVRFVQSYAQPLCLSTVAWGDRPRASKNGPLVEIELKQIISATDATTADLDFISSVCNRLSTTLYAEGKLSEADRCVARAIALAKRPNASEYARREIAEMYLRLALQRAHDPRMEKANEDFSEAVKAEEDKNGFHTTLVLFWWAFELKENGQPTSALMKLKTVVKMSRPLPAEKRGTILADALMLLSVLIDQRDKSQLKSLTEESSREIELQQKIGSKLGPDFYHRLQIRR